MLLKLDEEKGKAVIGGKLLCVVGCFREVRETFPRLACTEETSFRSHN